MTPRVILHMLQADLPLYAEALQNACNASPPRWDRKHYHDLYRISARDPDWVALSLITSAQSEGEGARHLADMAASTTDPLVAGQMRLHAIDESRHSLGYISMLGIVFPTVADDGLRKRLDLFSPRFNAKSRFTVTPRSPFGFSATVDELIQMNIAEVRTRCHHLLQRPVLLRYCAPAQRERLRQMLDWLLRDENNHIAYTAHLIERAAAADRDAAMTLMLQRMREFNALTEQELDAREVAVE
jgi:hypothetical protein